MKKSFFYKSYFKLIKKKNESLHLKSDKYCIFDIKTQNKKFDLIENFDDSTKDWTNFFIAKDKLHKIYQNNKENNFLLNEKLFSVQDEICDIQFIEKTDELVFFTKGHETIFHRIDNSKHEKIKIEHITCLNVDNEIVSIANGNGEIYLYKQGKLTKKIKVYELPITSCGYKEDYVYFSSFDGLIDRKKLTYSCKFLLFSLIFILLAIFIRSYKLFK